MQQDNERMMPGKGSDETVEDEFQTEMDRVLAPMSGLTEGQTDKGKLLEAMRVGVELEDVVKLDVPQESKKRKHAEYSKTWEVWGLVVGHCGPQSLLAVSATSRELHELTCAPTRDAEEIWRASYELEWGPVGHGANWQTGLCHPSLLVGRSPGGWRRRCAHRLWAERAAQGAFPPGSGDEPLAQWLRFQDMVGPAASADLRAYFVPWLACRVSFKSTCVVRGPEDPGSSMSGGPAGMARPVLVVIGPSSIPVVVRVSYDGWAGGEGPQANVLDVYCFKCGIWRPLWFVWNVGDEGGLVEFPLSKSVAHVLWGVPGPHYNDQPLGMQPSTSHRSIGPGATAAPSSSSVLIDDNSVIDSFEIDEFRLVPLVEPGHPIEVYK